MSILHRQHNLFDFGKEIFESTAQTASHISRLVGTGIDTGQKLTTDIIKKGEKLPLIGHAFEEVEKVKKGIVDPVVDLAQEIIVAPLELLASGSRIAEGAFETGSQLIDKAVSRSDVVAFGGVDTGLFSTRPGVSIGISDNLIEDFDEPSKESGLNVLFGIDTAKPPPLRPSEGIQDVQLKDIFNVATAGFGGVIDDLPDVFKPLVQPLVGKGANAVLHDTTLGDVAHSASDLVGNIFTRHDQPSKSSGVQNLRPHLQIQPRPLPIGIPSQTSKDVVEEHPKTAPILRKSQDVPPGGIPPVLIPDRFANQPFIRPAMNAPIFG